MKKTVFALPVGYELIQFLGEGLNSCVYRAIKENKEFGIRFEVALKILKSEKLVSLWRDEFERLSQVRSKHCVQLLGWEFISNKPTLVLEYVDGLTLNELSINASLCERLIQEIIAQAKMGLTDLAAAGVFHGDLNFHNIMIDSSGLVRLVDFGIYGADDAVFATPQFAAPEVLLGGKPNLNSDLCSLKLVMAELRSQHNIKSNSPDPNQLPEIQCQDELAKLVQRIMKYKKAIPGLTQNMAALNTQKSSLVAKFSQIVALLFLVFVPMLSQGDQKALKNKKYAKVSVRSSFWTQVSLANKEWRYAPCEILVAAHEEVTLNWKTQQKSGTTALTLEPGDHIVLDDSFFKEEKTSTVKGRYDRRSQKVTE